MKTATALATLLLAASLSAEKHHDWEKGKVMDLSSSSAGTYAAPIGTGTMTVPIYRTSNFVVVESRGYHMQWREFGRGAVILTVQGSVDFYRDGEDLISGTAQ